MSKYKYNKERGDVLTHTTYGSSTNRGSFSIPDEKMDEFYNLYVKCLHKHELNVIERQKEIGPYLIDIDFNFDKSLSKRQYTLDDIKNIISVFHDVANKYYYTEESTLLAFVMEKKYPSKKQIEGDYIWKDGFHIVFPNFPMSKVMRQTIFDDMLQHYIDNESFSHLECINQYDDIFDRNIVEHSGWTLYGSQKCEGPLYCITHVFDSNIEEVPKTEYVQNSEASKLNLLRLLSVRSYEQDDEIELIEQPETKNFIKNKNKNNKNSKNSKKESQSDDISQELEEYCDDRYNVVDEETEEDQIARRREQFRQNNENKKATEIMMAKKLVKILSSKRAAKYETWIMVGWALHNISTDLFPEFVEFSKRTSKGNFKLSSCEKVWRDAKNSYLSMASLKIWAKEDNVEKYELLMAENIKVLLNDAESGTEYDIAKVVYELYKDIYVCTSVTNNLWYEFQGHLWVEVQGCYTLNTRISEELTKEFAILSSYFMKKLGNNALNAKKNRDVFMSKNDNIIKIIKKLKNLPFKKRVIEECKGMFYKKTFEENLNSKRHIVGFNNGVYDLNARMFRDGTPDDMCSMSVGYDWEEYTMDHEFVGQLQDFLQKVQPNKDMREYIERLLASYLDGEIRDQKVVIWTGSGGNGKSKTVTFFQHAFGEYAGTLPVTVLTRKQGKANEATPEMAGMRGKRFVVFQEPGPKDEIQIAYMKEISGGDRIQARPLYKDPFYFHPQFKLLLCCNKLPKVDATDGGTWRRLRVTPWESKFVEKPNPNKKNEFGQDPELDSKLYEWRKVFLWYLITQAYPSYREQGLNPPAKVMEFTNKYKKNSDSILEFIETYLDQAGPKDAESVDDIWREYSQWYSSSYNMKPSQVKNELIEYLEANDYKLTKDKRKLCGYKFKDFNAEHMNDNDDVI